MIAGLPFRGRVAPVHIHVAPAPSGGDDTAALAAFIASVPNGRSWPRTIRFQPGTYRIDSLLQLSNRHWLTFDLNGATIDWNTVDNDARRLLWFVDSSHITVKNGTLLGTYTYPATGDAHNAALQHMHAIEFDQTSHASAQAVTISGFYGDGVYVGSEAGVSRSTNVQVVGCDIRQVGRNAVSVVAGNDVHVQGNQFQQTGYWGVDIEPILGGLTCNRVTVNGNTWGGQVGTTTRRVFGVVPRVAVSDVVFTNNTINGRNASVWINNTGSDTPWEARVANLVMSGNTCDQDNTSGIWNLLATDNVDISGNTIPVSSGVVVALRDVCSHTISGSSFLEVTPCA